MPNKLPVLSEEEQLLQTELTKIATHPKLALWVKYFFDKSNKQTYGNRTQSAILAYGLDPVEQYVAAGVIGSENFRKLKVLGALYYEQNGMKATDVLDLIAAHAVNKGGKALELLAVVSGVYEPKAMVAIQNNTVTNIQVTHEESKQFKNEFEEFINEKYSKPPALPVLDPSPLAQSTG